MIGQTISHYKILEKLGEGGMGIVYKAHDTKLDRLVALKFLPQQINVSEEDKARFLQESKAISALNHPNIATIHNIDEADDQRFLVLEYIPGGTLKSKLKYLKSEDKEFSLAEVLDCGIQAAEALAHAHRHQIIHRDVKTDNLMLTDDGKVKLTDFGLAKLRGSAQVTKTGTTVGTAAYMSPEQIRGEEIDQRSDIFSLGVVLYELLTLHLPFRGEFETALSYSILNEDPVSVKSLRKNVPPALVRIIDRCLEKDRTKRFQDAAEVILALKEIQSNLSPASKVEKKKKKLALIIGGCLIAITVLTYFVLMHQPVPTNKKSIAVLPFKNFNDSKEDEYFSDGITEDVITQLSKITDLKVISRTAIMKYKQSSQSPKEIGRELDVATLLEGSVRRAGDSVRIVAQLIDAKDEGHLWAETYDKTLTQIFAVQSDVAQKIAAELKAKLLPGEKERIEKKPTENAEAYILYLKGRHFFFLETYEDLTKSLSFFQQAIARDPKFALGWSGLSSAYFMLDLNCGDQPMYYSQSLAAAETALELDSTLAEGWVALGLIQMAYELHWKSAEQSYKRAIEFNPNNWNAHREYGELLMRTGRVDGAITEFKKAVELEPLSFHPLTWLGWAHLEAGNHKLAIEELEKASELVEGRYTQTRFALGREYLREGLLEKARALYKNADTYEQIWFDAMCGDKQRALLNIVQLENAPINPSWMKNFYLMTAYAYQGQNDSAISRLEYFCRSNPMRYINIKIIPYLDGLHSDPRYIALLKKAGLQE